MPKSKLLYRYPCGCVGYGRPHPPRKETGTDAVLSVWEDVLVVRVCDARDTLDMGWCMPSPRELVAPYGAEPEKVKIGMEEDFLLYLGRAERLKAAWDLLGL